MKPFVNWARTASCTPAAFAAPRDEEELRRIVIESKRVKVVGGAHSWSDAACTDAECLELTGNAAADDGPR